MRTHSQTNGGASGGEEMKNQAILSRYKELAAFLHMCLGRNIEIVVHDLRDPDHSVVAIYNNDISRRSIGAPLTDFALNIVREKLYEKKSCIVNYSGKSHDGLELRSSTYFIKNNRGDLIGLFCLNIDVTRHQRLADELRKLIEGESPTAMDNVDGEDEARSGAESGYHEIFPASVSDMIDIIVKQKMGGVPAARLTTEEKTAVVDELSGQGVFMLKGSIPAAAERLGISEATVYRYLSKLKRQKTVGGAG